MQEKWIWSWAKDHQEKEIATSLMFFAWKSHDVGKPVGYSPWNGDHKELGMTEQQHTRKV